MGTVPQALEGQILPLAILGVYAGREVKRRIGRLREAKKRGGGKEGGGRTRKK
jgi:hypothetical protein